MIGPRSGMRLVAGAGVVAVILGGAWLSAVLSWVHRFDEHRDYE